MAGQLNRTVLAESKVVRLKVIDILYVVKLISF